MSWVTGTAGSNPASSARRWRSGPQGVRGKNFPLDVGVTANEVSARGAEPLWGAKRREAGSTPLVSTKRKVSDAAVRDKQVNPYIGWEPHAEFTLPSKGLDSSAVDQLPDKG